jgi:hypothetical protein
MTTNTRGTWARDYNKQLVHYIRHVVNYNDAGIASGVAIGKYIPSGAIVVGTDVLVTASFNANSTNVLTVGVNGLTANDIVASGDVNEASAQLFQNIAPGSGLTQPSTADKQLYVKYTQTGGTVATSGKAHIVVKYIPNNG